MFFIVKKVSDKINDFIIKVCNYCNNCNNQRLYQDRVFSLVLLKNKQTEKQ